jgi:hypothetical protein
MPQQLVLSQKPLKRQEIWCIWDQSIADKRYALLTQVERLQNKTREPAAGASFYGRPPLKVFTSGVAQVDIYYQGIKVRPSNSAAKNCYFGAG